MNRLGWILRRFLRAAPDLDLVYDPVDDYYDPKHGKSLTRVACDDAGTRGVTRRRRRGDTSTGTRPDRNVVAIAKLGERGGERGDGTARFIR